MVSHTAKKRSWDWLQDENAPSSQLAVRRGSAPGLDAEHYFRPFSNFMWDVERMFDNNLRSLGLPRLSGMPAMWSIQAFSPALNIAATEDAYIITVEVPGMEEKDIKLDISPEGLLTVSGEKRQESEEKSQEFERMECAYGSFRRSLSLPTDVDREAVEARFKNGVLTIACPRREKGESQNRQIPIGSGKGGHEGGRSAGGHQPQGAKKAA